MCYRINSRGKRVTGVSYYGPDGSDNTIEAEIVVLGTFIYDNTRLLLLSKTDAFPNGLGRVAHPTARSFATKATAGETPAVPGTPALHKKTEPRFRGPASFNRNG